MTRSSGGSTGRSKNERSLVLFADRVHRVFPIQFFIYGRRAQDRFGHALGDDALCQLRFCHEDIGLVLLQTRGSIEAVLEAARAEPGW